MLWLVVTLGIECCMASVLFQNGECMGRSSAKRDLFKLFDYVGASICVQTDVRN